MYCKLISLERQEWKYSDQKGKKNEVGSKWVNADFHLTGSDRIGTKEDIQLVEIDVNVNFNQWNVFFCSNPVGSSVVEISLKWFTNLSILVRGDY